MPKRPIFGVLLAAGALALLLSFKTPSDTGITGSGNPAASGNRSTYTGQVTGSAIQTPYGVVQVQLTISGGRITEITLLQAPQGGRDTQITDYAVPLLRSAVLSAQSAGVDTISGATYTSQGYLQSVQSALDQLAGGLAGGPVAAAQAPTSGVAAANPAATSGSGAGAGSSYSGSVTGQSVMTPYGVVQVQVTFVGGRITDVTVLQAPQGGRDSQLTSYATPRLRSEVLSAQSTNVDTVSGATYTSMGYLQSVQSALDQAGA